MGRTDVEGTVSALFTGDPNDEGKDPRIGEIVDRYTIVRRLGKGGMGAVYEALNVKIGRRMAIKFLLPEFATKPDILRRFRNEARAAGGLEHPNLAAVIDLGRANDGSPYLLMEYLEGEDCSKLLGRKGPLPVRRAANIVIQACRGLAVAHKAGIVHRDLKPENLFLAVGGDGTDLVKVLDFGIAKLRPADGSIATGTGETFGTAYYMSPEQARGSAEVDHRTDVWSLGVVLYEFLGGRKPFMNEQVLQVLHRILDSAPPPLAALRPGLPPALVAVVEQAMAKDITQRFQTVTDLADALAPFECRASGGFPPVESALGATFPTPATGSGQCSPNRAAGISGPPELNSSPNVSRFPPTVLVSAGLLLIALFAVVAAVARRGAHSENGTTLHVPAANAGASLPSSPPPPSSGAPTPTPTPTPRPVHSPPKLDTTQAVRSSSGQSGQSEQGSNHALPPTAASEHRKRVPAPRQEVRTLPAEPPPPRGAPPKPNDHPIILDQDDPYR